MAQNGEAKITGLLNALNLYTAKPKKQLDTCEKLVALITKSQNDFIRDKGFQDFGAFENSSSYKRFCKWSSDPLLDHSKLHEYALETYELWAEVACPDLSYGLLRLVSGLASENPQIRCSFATCLTAMLRRLDPYVSLRILIHEMFTRLGASPLGPHGTNNAQDWLIGRICLLVSCTRAGLFGGNIDNPTLLNGLLCHIFHECIPAKSYLGFGFATALVGIMLQVPFELLKEFLNITVLSPTPIRTLDHFYVALVSFSIYSTHQQTFPSQDLLIQACMDRSIYHSIGLHRSGSQMAPIFTHLVAFLLSTDVDVFRAFWELIILSDFIPSKSTCKNQSAFDVILCIMEGIQDTSSEKASEIIAICWGLKGKVQKHHNLLHRLFRETISFKQATLKQVATDTLLRVFLAGERLPKDARNSFKLAMEQNRPFWTTQPSAASKMWSSLFSKFLIASSSPTDISQLIGALSSSLDLERVSITDLNHNIKLIFSFIVQNKEFSKDSTLEKNSLERSMLEKLSIELWQCILKMLHHQSIIIEFKQECFNRFKRLLSSVFLLRSTSRKSLEYSSSEEELALNIRFMDPLIEALLKSFDSSLSAIKMRQITRGNSDGITSLNTPKLLSIGLFVRCLKLLYYALNVIDPSERQQQLFEVINDVISLLNKGHPTGAEKLSIPPIDQLIDIILASLSIEFSLCEGPIYNIILCWKETFTAGSIDLLVQALTSPLENDLTDDEDMVEDESSTEESSEEPDSHDDSSPTNFPPNVLSHMVGASEYIDIPLESISEDQMEVFDTSLKSISILLRKNADEKQHLKRSLTFYSRTFSILSFVLDHCPGNVFDAFLESLPDIETWLKSLSKISKDNAILEFKKRALLQVDKWMSKAKEDS